MSNQIASPERSRVTADTNIFYYLGSGALSKEDVVGEGDALWATPINVLEILAGVSLEEWTERRDAATAIVQHADAMAADPEEHLAASIERRPAVGGNIWLEAAMALGQAKSEYELKQGVADFSERVVRVVDTPVAAAAKAKHYDDFKFDIIKVCDDLLPGYRAAIENGTQAPVAGKSVRDLLRRNLCSPQFVVAVFFGGIVGRYRLIAARDVDLESDNTFLALRELAPYCGIYGAYLRELLTARRKPESNDWGDLELFLYLQPGTFVATTEKKWWTIADLVGLGGRVRKIVVRTGAAE